VHGSAETISVYLVAGLGAAQLVGNPLGAVAAHRWGKFGAIFWSLIVMTVGTVLVALVPGVPLIFVMVLVVGCFSMLLFPPMMSYMPEVVARPEQVGPATGINTAMGFVGSLVAPWLFGLFLDAGNQSESAYMAGYVMLAAFGVAAIIGMVFFRRLTTRTP
jgi:MFS family permease